MFHRFWLTAFTFAVACGAGPAAAAPAPDDSPSGSRNRTFLFTYSTTLTGLPAGKTVRIWLPVPPSNGDQQVKIVSEDLPAKGRLATEPRFGNQILYVEGKAPADGTLKLRVPYRVTRHEVKADLRQHPEGSEKFAKFLEPDARVPVGGKPLELLKGKKVPEDQLAAGRLLYDVVNQHMRYSKEGTGWGQGDAVWACESGFGNCSDFHSLFISLARAQQIPAKFEMGFPLPEKRGAGDIPGYHCWAKFRPAGKGWVPVDISEANKTPKRRDYYFGNLTPDRVAFSTGRDLVLVPRQSGKPLNFFIYPYVEVDDQPLPADRIKNHFSFQDLPEQGGE
jgi:transglutaminase-like putative cysteine protease